MAQSPSVSILTDESTDIAVCKMLVIYVRIMNESFQPQTVFLTNIQVVDGTAATITAELIKAMDVWGIQHSRVTGLGSDGAAVMTSLKNGVAGRLKREVNKKIVNIHCVSHRLAL